MVYIDISSISKQSKTLWTNLHNKIAETVGLYLDNIIIS